MLHILRMNVEITQKILQLAVNGITGIKINHFASFNFEGFENIIDSFDGIEICVETTQREGYAFELQKGCQVVTGATALNWVVLEIQKS